VGDLYPVDVIGARSAGLQAVLLDPWDTFDIDVDRIPSVAALPEYLAARSEPSVEAI
jgi:FMN phosphatase YigB (HAD superfamily)